MGRARNTRTFVAQLQGSWLSFVSTRTRALFRCISHKLSHFKLTWTSTSTDYKSHPVGWNPFFHAFSSWEIRFLLVQYSATFTGGRQSAFVISWWWTVTRSLMRKMRERTTHAESVINYWPSSSIGRPRVTMKAGQQKQIRATKRMVAVGPVCSTLWR
jgi:hypothetical protein